MAETWRVERHGGHTHDRWFAIVHAPEYMARDFYDAAQQLVHRGYLRLIRPPGEIVDAYAAPKSRRDRMPA